jgi:hypothetical protein
VLRIRKLLLFMLLIAQVHALSIAPGTVDISANRTVDLLVRNTEDHGVMVGVIFAGELQLMPESSEVYIPPYSEASLSVAVLSSDLEPGRHCSQLGVYEKNEGTTTVSAVAGVVSNICTSIPYPGRYLSMRIAANDKDIVVKASNQGAENLTAKALVEISDGRMEKRLTAEKPVMVGETRELVMPHGLSQGMYTARAAAEYAKPVEMDFIIGAPTVYLLSMQSRLSGEYFEVRAEVDSDWNRPVKAFATLDAGDYTTTSSTVEISPGGRQVIRLFWPAAQSREAILTIHHSGRSESAQVFIEEMPREGRPWLWLSACLATLALIAIIMRFHGKKR